LELPGEIGNPIEVVGLLLTTGRLGAIQVRRNTVGTAAQSTRVSVTSNQHTNAHPPAMKSHTRPSCRTRLCFSTLPRTSPERSRAPAPNAPAHQPRTLPRTSPERSRAHHRSIGARPCSATACRTLSGFFCSRLRGRGGF
jgi:hypothetical protein